MGKASKWFRSLLGLKKPDPNTNPPPKNSVKKKWSFAKSQKRNDVVQYNDDANKQAVAVTEAAFAAAQAAVVSVRKSHKFSVAPEVRQSGGRYGRRREEWAAVMIQSHFRAYLSRRALRALKGLVKLQALVRGHLMRKRTADALRQLQALVRAQRRARIGRILSSESPYSSLKSSHFTHHEPATPEKHEQVIRARSMKHEQPMMLKRNSSKSKSSGSVNYDLEKSHLSRFRTDNRVHNNILEADSKNPQRRNFFHSSHLSLGSDPTCQSFSTSKESTARHAIFSPESNEGQSLSPMKFVEDLDESDFCTADNSPRFYSASSSRREEFTPIKSDCSRSCLSNYSDYPSYMSYTESSKAKVRSVSAPKQRPQYERSGSTKRYSINGFGEQRLSTQRVSQMQANFVNKAYPGSGRLDRLGMPVRGDVAGFSGGLFHRY